MTPNNSSVRFDLETHATDFVPDALAADTLRGVIHQKDVQLKGIDDEIAQLRVRLRALEEQMTEVAEFRDLHRAFLAPIRKLAPEILGEVFMQYLLASRVERSARFKDGFDVCLPLLQVCIRWRRIILGTPGLWTVLQVAPGTQDRVQMCLNNSRSLPIQVHLDPYNLKGSSEIRLLLNNFHRVREIKGYGFPLMQEILRRECILQTPVLRVVHLAGSARCSQDECFRLQNIIQAPPIESLELKDCLCLFSIFCRNPGKLRRLKLAEERDSDLYTPALLDILPFSSSLQGLHLQLPKQMMAIRKDVPKITLPHLRSLSLMGRRDHICELLASLDVPSLHCLTLVCLWCEPEVTPSWIPIQTFLRGDPPPLRFLTLDHVSLEHGFVDFISRLSHLEHLRLDECHMTDEHLLAFILDHNIPQDNMVCPKLATLSLTQQMYLDEGFVEVVESRAPLPGMPWKNRCLRSVECQYWNLPDHCRRELEDISEACGGLLTLDLEQWL